MNALESQLEYLGERLPEPGETVEVAPGVRWLRMKLPFQLNHINLWLLRDGSRPTRRAGARAGRSSIAASPTTRRTPRGQGSSRPVSTACPCCA